MLLLLLLLLQVTAEFRKANGLIKPGPKTIKVWAALYAEIEKVSSRPARRHRSRQCVCGLNTFGWSHVMVPPPASSTTRCTDAFPSGVCCYTSSSTAPWAGCCSRNRLPCCCAPCHSAHLSSWDQLSTCTSSCVLCTACTHPSACCTLRTHPSFPYAAAATLACAAGVSGLPAAAGAGAGPQPARHISS
eukprot:GHRQ01032539.1.p1 GENE.GHRQ01032539.1~~GHRQ01032539.1.p1  ORF type:complete len:189 (-),score=40.05 GHRQ01032539.1:113-679(-)